MKKYTQKELDGMNEWQILYLLQKQPQLIHKVNIRKMGGCSRAFLLQEQPQLDYYFNKK